MAIFETTSPTEIALSNLAVFGGFWSKNPVSVAINSIPAYTASPDANMVGMRNIVSFFFQSKTNAYVLSYEESEIAREIFSTFRFTN